MPDPYTPTNWKSGDVITAEKLNKIENAIPPLIVTETETGNNYEHTIGVSYNDIYAAILNGQSVFLSTTSNNSNPVFLTLTSLIHEGEEYLASFNFGDFEYNATTASGLLKDTWETTYDGPVVE